MRKLGVFLLGALSLAIFTNPTVYRAQAEAISVYVGGMPAGFTLTVGGVQVLGFCDIMTEKGMCSPAANAGMQAGDRMIAAAGIPIENIGELNEILNKNKEKELIISVERGNERMEIALRPVKDKVTDRYKIGVLIRDGVSGIGTVTYVEKESGKFGALGHAVAGEYHEIMRVADGIVYPCSIVGVSKGIRGRAGELRGLFLTEKSLGSAEKLSTCGIYGRISDHFDKKRLKTAIASAESVKIGKATIFSTVSGELPGEYKIEIVKIDKNNKENKNYVIKIVDDALIEQTGGIVQGMSGSPILQNGNLVGAITHVFVNDPTRGYGISIDEMLAQ